MIYKPRDISAIFPDYYIGAPDEQFVRRRCATHMGEATMPEDIYRWIDRETCPYMREAYAGTCLSLLEEWQEDEEHRLRYDVREMAELELRKIIRYAQTDQIAEERLAAELGVKDNPATRDASATEHLLQLQLQVSQLVKDVAELKARHQSPCVEAHWPMFTAKATDAEKQAFEARLRAFCTSTKRTHSHEVKGYLELKESEGIITRPAELKKEHEILQNCFDYKPTYSAYHNA